MWIKQVGVGGSTLLLALTLSSTAGAQSAAPDLTSQRKPPPRRLSYDEGQPIPDGYRLRSEPHKGLLITGAIMGGGAYAFSVMGAVDTSFEDNAGYLLIPIAGPWLMLAAGNDPPEPCPMGETCPTGNPSYKGLAVGAAGVLQAVGAVLFITGVMTERRYLERKDVEVSIVPTSLGNDGYGLGAVGTF
jgi:hypothetical protein